MKIQSRKKVSFSWGQAKQIAERVRNLDGLGDTRREQYATLILLAAGSGLHCSELLALRLDDLDFRTSTIRVDESSDQRNCGRIGPCKNATAYRTVVMQDVPGKGRNAGSESLPRPLQASGLDLLLEAQRSTAGNHHTESRALSGP